MIKKGLWKKSASILMAAAMIMTSVPVYAAEADEQSGEVIVQEASEETADEAQEISLEESLAAEGDSTQPAEGSETGSEGSGEEQAVSYAAQIGDSKYEALDKAIMASKENDTIQLLSNISSADAKNYSLKKGVTLNGNGHTVSGNVSFYVTAGNITIENVNFTDIHSTADCGTNSYYGWQAKTGSRSAIYAEGLQNRSLTIRNCSFDQIDWEAMQLTSIPDGSEITITGNTFRNSKMTPDFSGEDATNISLRYIHMQVSLGNIKLDISNNNFYNSTIGNALGIYGLGAQSQLTAGNNYFDNDKVDIAIGFDSGEEPDLKDLFLPLRETEDAASADYYPEIIYADKSARYAAGWRFAPSLSGLLGGSAHDYEIKLAADISSTDSITADGKATIDLNGQTLSAGGINGNVTITGTGFCAFNPAEMLDENCTATKNEDGTWQVVEKCAAKIGEMEYQTLPAAIFAAKVGDTITLLHNINTAAKSISVPAGKDITLDLNGCAIVGTFQFVLENEGTLRVVDSSEKKTGIVKSTFKEDQSYPFFNQGTAVIDGGTYEGSIPIRNFSANSTVTINNAIVNGKLYGVYADNGTLEINGGYFSSPSYHIGVIEGTTTIKGGYYQTAQVSNRQVADGYVILPNSDENESVYGYKVVQKDDTQAVEPAVAEPTVNTAGLSGLEDADIEKVKTAAENVKARELKIYANEVAADIGEDEAVELLKTGEASLKENNIDVSAAQVHIYAQTFLDITPIEFTKAAEGTAPVYTLDIVPKYQLVASTAADSANIQLNDGESKNAVVIEKSVKLDTTNKVVRLTIQLPDGFITGEAPQTLLVKHTKDNKKTYYHDAKVTTITDKDNNPVTYKISFDNSYGFSKFQIMAPGTVAEVNGTGYTSVTAALNAANGETVKLLADVDSTGTTIELSSDKNAVLDLNGHMIKGALSNSGNLTITDTSAGKAGAITGDISSIQGGMTAIEAGTFDGLLFRDGVGKFSISGGIFTKGPVVSEDCAPGYKPNANGTGVTRIQTPSYSTNNNLSSLTISEGTLTPAFNKDTTSYTVSVGADVESITVTPVRENNYATIKVNGTSVTSGEASAPIALKEGENTITVEVTAESGAKKTYTLTVVRETASTPTPTPAPASDASLLDLTISEGTLSPEFSAEEENYKAVVENAVDKLLVTPKTAGANSKVTVNGKPASEEVELKVGYNTIKVEVTAEDGKTTKTYTIDVTRVVPKNKTLTIRRRKYKVTNELIAKGAVQITGLSDKKVYNLSVPDTIKIYGVTYKVTSVGKNAFRDQPKMKTAKLGNNITSIGYGAFYSCPRLKSITLGKRVKSIGNHAFCRDVKLRTLTLEGTALTKVAAHTLYKTKNLTIKAPASKVKAYKKLFTGKGTKSFKVVKK